MTFSTDDGSIYLLYIFVALPILVVFPLVVRIISRLRLRHMARAQTIVTMYESPDRLSPAELGYMYDASLNDREFIATVFDLEYRGVIKIDKEGRISLDTNNLQTQTLKMHEKFIVTRILGGEYTSVMQSLNIIDNQLFKQELNKCLANDGLIRDQFYLRIFFGALRATRNVFIFYSSLLIISVGSLLFTSPLSITEVLIMCLMLLVGFTLIFGPLYVVLGLILTFIYVKLDGMRWIGTKKLRQIWPAIEGYRIYIKQAQLDRLNFASEELRIQALEKDFAYAIALGMNVDWKSRFGSRYTNTKD